MKEKLVLLLALAGSIAANVMLQTTNHRLRDSITDIVRDDTKLKEANEELKSADAHLKTECEKLAHNADLLSQANQRLMKVCR